MSDDTWMRFMHGSGAPTGCIWQGVYIGDHVTLGVARHGRRKSDLAQCEDLVRRSEAAYAGAGLARHPGKEARGANKATV